MKKGMDISAKFQGLYVVHQNLPKKKTPDVLLKEHTFFVPLRGEFQIQVEDKNLTVGPGHMVYVPPLTKHSFYSNSKEGERLIFLIEKIKGPTKTPKKIVSQQLYKEILFFLLLNKTSSHAQTLIKVLIDLIADQLQESPENLDINHISAKAKDSRLFKAIEYVEKNFGNELKMSQLAQVSGLSVRSLNRLFISQVSMTPKQFHTRVRIQEAQKLLKNKSKSVTEVAFECGFGSLSQFIRSFRLITGKIPSDF